MIHTCQLTEISEQDFPEFYQFYHHFPEKYPFFLTTTSQQSSGSLSQSDGSFSDSSYDILFIEPQQWLKLDYKLELTASSQLHINPDDTFLDAFDHYYQLEKNKQSGHQYLPFTGGWFIFLGYELAQQIEPCLKLPLDKQQLPVAYAARVKTALIFDHGQKKLFFVSEPDIDHDTEYRDVIADSQIVLKKMQQIIPGSDDFIATLTEDDEKDFLHSVDVVKSYIKEGDVFQVNLSRLWQSELQQSGLSQSETIDSHSARINHSEMASTLYQLLSVANPAPFSGLASFTSEQGLVTIISSSPERLLKITNNQLESRPIAGTRPRSTSEQEDARLIDELHQHPKEQAEHIMLIDLIRNDLGRVCVPGTVVANELMVNESYAHVHHIVSNVIGQLQANKTPSDAIKAMFPGGTITGCPKVRCMEIIAELEQQSRGAYTGSMGYINLDGSMDLNILIRTMVLDNSNKLSFRAGAGLVFDSIANNELQETRAKAKGLIKALQV